MERNGQWKLSIQRGSSKAGELLREIAHTDGKTTINIEEFRHAEFALHRIKGERRKAKGLVKVSVDCVINVIWEAGTERNKFHEWAYPTGNVSAALFAVGGIIYCREEE